MTLRQFIRPFWALGVVITACLILAGGTGVWLHDSRGLAVHIVWAWILLIGGTAGIVACVTMCRKEGIL